MPAARPTQGDLFAKAVRPRARKDAPVTAKVAGHPRRALRRGDRVEGASSWWPASRSPTPWPRVRPRFTNLLDAKLIRRTGLERPSGLGNPMAVCDATAEGRELLARQPRPHQPCELYTIKRRAAS